MQEIIVDEEFRGVLPALNKEIYKQLEESIIQNGCRDALVIWNGILIDGYNRYIICTEHDVPFQTVEKAFDSREEALIWIITNQVSRRNLLPIQLSYCRGLHYHADRKLVKNESGKNQHTEPGEVYRHNDDKPKNRSTVARLAEQYLVSPKTIERDSKVAEALNAIGLASPGAKSRILSGEVKLDKKALAGFLSGQKEDIEAVAMEIEGGTYKKKAPAAPAPANPVGYPPSKTGGLAGSFPEEIRQWKGVIIGITNVFCSELSSFTKIAEIEDFMIAMRSYIDSLEDLYGEIDVAEIRSIA